MSNNLNDLISYYQDEKRFMSCVEYTADRTGFSSELIEKDFLCSLVLIYLYSSSEIPLTFKGGTLLAKVHSDFYRLSEDLDFSIPTEATSNRKSRSNAAKPMKNIIEDIEHSIPIFNIMKPLTGSNESRQYNAELNYKSKSNFKTNRILIEIGLREKLVLF